jgi:type IV pilus assembly protein PilA
MKDLKTKNFMGGNAMKMNKKGFTLIELLIVVAIIAILAAIAIPQFAQYRIKGYNASALSDLRNCRTSQESLFADWQRYGKTEKALLPGAGGVGMGAILTGPTTPPANETILTLTDANLTVRGLDIAIGNNIDLVSGVDPLGGSYIIETKNRAGDTCYAADSDSTGNFRAQNTLYITFGLAAGTPVLATMTPGAIEPALLAAPWSAM